MDICPIDDLPPGAKRVVTWEDLEIGIVNCAGDILAIEDRCSHDNGDLMEGERRRGRRAPSSAPATVRCSICGPESP